VCIDFDCSVITGDLNVHLDVAQDKHAKELTAVLKMFGLTQHVNEPTHSRGHTLDVLISKGVVIFKCGCRRCCFFDLSVTPKPAVGSAVVRGRLINDRTGTQFMEIIRFENTPYSNVDDLLNSYTSSLLNILDIIAPVKVRMVKSRQKAPWKKEDSVRAQKRDCRRAEWKWRKSKLQVHYEIYKEKLCVFNQTLLQ